MNNARKHLPETDGESSPDSGRNGLKIDSALVPANRRMFKQFTIKQLHCFMDVCRLGGYAAAAREQMLTTSAVWEQIKLLEKHFGTRLVVRDGRCMRPTPRGTRLLEMVRPHLDALESTRDIFQQEDERYPEQLVLVSHLRIAVEQISQAMAGFHLRFPSVRLQFHDTKSEHIQRLVLNRTTDLALTLQTVPGKPLSKLLAFELVGELDYLLIMPPHHPLSRAKSLRLESIVKYPMILGQANTYSRQRTDEVFHRHDLVDQMHVVAEIESDEYTPAWVRAGMGVGIGVGIASNLLYSDLEVRSLRSWFGAARVGFLWRRDIVIPPLQRELADLLREKLCLPSVSNQKMSK